MDKNHPVDQSGENVQELEAEYYALYNELQNKLNKLVYIKNLNTEDSNTGDSNSEVQKLFNMVDPSELSQFFKRHTRTKNEVIETVSMVLPILKSIHFSNTFNRANDIRIYETINKLYSLENGVVFEEMALYEKLKVLQFDKQKLTNELGDIVEKLKKKLGELVPRTESTREYTDEEIQLYKQSEFIQLLISNLPANWYTNGEIFEILESCQEMSRKEQ